MCIACGSGIPVCALNSACTISVQQAVGTGVIFGAGFFAVLRVWLQTQGMRFLYYIKENNKRGWN